MGSFLGSLGLIALAIVMWRQGLEQADRIASVVSMFTGICGLTASLAVPAFLQRRRSRDRNYPGLAMLKSLSFEPSGVVSYLGIVQLPNGRGSEWEVALPPAAIVANPWENRETCFLHWGTAAGLNWCERFWLLRRPPSN
ncbi:hypothetical protein [Nocardia sp. bgisy134]|uniref:hypothetical protein n=1 Tax=unclassified Nocardia TaxID=2637762 RepID=UPI003D712EBE